jgi:erythronate-4-phosphate dehydrogenase
MILAVDETIPYWESAFASLGELRPFSCGDLRPADFRDADALLVRSTLRITGSLLDGSSVRFVGTASAGMDNLDEDYLEERGIYFTNAAGCNANAVAEYVIAALLRISERYEWNLEGRSLAVIGAGHVGSRVATKARALGLKVMLCDPPLRETTGDPQYRLLHQVIDADILTFHVPLTRHGPYPTFHMVDAPFLSQLAARQFIFNTARGAVCDGTALKPILQARGIAGAVLDVWEDEPRIDYTLLTLAALGTPHIAGFSLNGKIRATEIIREQLCRFFHLSNDWDAGKCYPSPVQIQPTRGSSGQAALRSIVGQVYDVERDDRKLRQLQPYGTERSALEFDRLRDQYDLRPEFRDFVVDLSPETSELEDALRGLGFQVFAPTATSGGN